jgi:hypothetical protein
LDLSLSLSLSREGKAEGLREGSLYFISVNLWDYRED